MTASGYTIDVYCDFGNTASHFTASRPRARGGVMVRISDVPAWLILSGVGHVISHSSAGWHRTICGTLTPTGEPRRERPPRICSACQAVLRRPETRRADCSLADGI